MPTCAYEHMMVSSAVKLFGMYLQGTCRNGVCVCKPGYSGTYCEVSPECGVILDINGNCCNHGIISADGICCGPVCVSQNLLQVYV